MTWASPSQRTSWATPFIKCKPPRAACSIILYQGVKLGIYPPLIFMGVGAMTDFAPLIANPKSLLLGAAAQLGIFLAFILAQFCWAFDPQSAGSIGIIGGADGPTAIFVTTRLAPQLLGPIAVAAYSYMALVPIIQPPDHEGCSPPKRSAPLSWSSCVPSPSWRRSSSRSWSPSIVALLLPDAAPLVGMLMLGNLVRESGVVERLSKTAQNELMQHRHHLPGPHRRRHGQRRHLPDAWAPLKIIVAGPVRLRLRHRRRRAAGQADVQAHRRQGQPADRLGRRFGRADGGARFAEGRRRRKIPSNFLLMHAMGPNVAGVIGSAVAAGVFAGAVLIVNRDRR